MTAGYGKPKGSGVEEKLHRVGRKCRSEPASEVHEKKTRQWVGAGVGHSFSYSKKDRSSPCSSRGRRAGIEVELNFRIDI